VQQGRLRARLRRATEPSGDAEADLARIAADARRLLSEAGVAGYETGLWLGLMAPKATPRPVLEKVNAEVNKLLNSTEVKENWAKQGTITMGMSIDQFDRFLRADVQKWSKLVKDTGMKVD